MAFPVRLAAHGETPPDAVSDIVAHGHHGRAEKEEARAEELEPAAATGVGDLRLDERLLLVRPVGKCSGATFARARRARQENT